MWAVSRSGADRTWPTCSYPTTASPVSRTCRICASTAWASMPGWTSAKRRPSRRGAGPPPNCSRAALDHTKRRSVSTMAMPMGAPATICSSTVRLMYQPGASATFDRSTSQREPPCASSAEAIRATTRTGFPFLLRAVSSPVQPPSLRQRSTRSGTRSASSAASRSDSFLPTASDAGYASRRLASSVQPVTTPCGSSSRGTASATSNRRRATPYSSCAPTGRPLCR